jgi:dethiobiotin synthetase
VEIEIKFGIVMVIILIAGIIIALLAVNSVNQFNSTLVNVYGQSDAQVNKPPVILVTSPVAGKINQTVIINASISDPDGNITSIIWNQEDESRPAMKMNISPDKQSMSFIPTQSITHVFSVEAIDNNGSTTLESVEVNIG